MLHHDPYPPHAMSSCDRASRSRTTLGPATVLPAEAVVLDRMGKDELDDGRCSLDMGGWGKHATGEKLGQGALALR